MNQNEKSQADFKVPESIEELKGMLKRAESGDQAALPLVKQIVEFPGGIDVLGGDLAKTAEQSFILALSADNLSFQIASDAQTGTDACRACRIRSDAT